MKATGIVRRIDDLGRVVIPKEIRRTLRIRDGDPLEIFTEKDGEVIFKKYSPMGDLNELAGRVCEAVQKNLGFTAAISDRDTVIAASGQKRKELMDRRLTAGVIRRLEDRERYSWRGKGSACPLVENGETALGAAAPILSEGDLVGGVFLTADPERRKFPGELEEKLIDILAGILGKQIEN